MANISESQQIVCESHYKYNHRRCKLTHKQWNDMSKKPINITIKFPKEEKVSEIKCISNRNRYQYVKQCMDYYFKLNRKHASWIFLESKECPIILLLQTAWIITDQVIYDIKHIAQDLPLINLLIIPCYIK